MTHKPSAPDHHVRGVVHDYWIERRELRKKAKAQGRRRGEGGPARPQAYVKKKNIYFYLTKWRKYGTIPYNLNERKNYGLFSTKNTS